MKNWLKILTGKTTTSASEILAEIDNLKTEQAGVKTKLTEAKESLSQARVELYGGSGDQAGVDALEDDVKNFQIQVDTLDRAIMDLKAKHGEAIEREKQAQIAEIDKKISGLRKWMTDIRPDYVRAKVMVEAFERLLTGPTLGVGMASKQDLLITGKERSDFQAEVDAITRGHGSIMAEIMNLQQQKKTILER